MAELNPIDQAIADMLGQIPGWRIDDVEKETWRAVAVFKVRIINGNGMSAQSTGETLGTAIDNVVRLVIEEVEHRG